MELRVDGDHVDLAERRACGRGAPSSSRTRRAPPSMSCSRKPFGSNHGSASRSSMSSRVHAPCSGWEANARLFTRARRPRPGRRRTSAARARRSSTAISGSTGRGRRIWNSCRSSRSPCSAATARSAAPASFDHQCTIATAVGLGHGERGTDHTSRGARVAARRPARGRPRRSRCRCRAPRAPSRGGRPPSSRALAISTCRRRLVGRCRSAPRPEAMGSIPSSAMGRPRTPKGRALETERRLAEEYPDAVCALDFHSPFELLAATILSAQCTDERVNMVTPELFAGTPRPRRWRSPTPPSSRRSSGRPASSTTRRRA